VEFLEWRSTQLKPDWQAHLEAQKTGEDTLLGLWCLVTGRKVWHPIPTPLDHDITLASTYGNDGHRARRPIVRWDTYRQFNALPSEVGPTDADHWRPVPDVTWTHLGIFPGWHLPMLARREVIEYGDEQAKADMADDGRSGLARFLPDSGLCWSCIEQSAVATTHITGAALCRPCVVQLVAALIGAKP
jgi:hypothetical protein